MRRTVIKHQGNLILYKIQEAVKLFGITLWWKDVLIERTFQKKNLVVFVMGQFDTETEAREYFANMNKGDKKVVNVFNEDKRTFIL